MSEPARKRVEKELLALKKAIDADTEDALLDAVTKKPSNIIVTPGPEFKVSINRISASVRAELESQGYDVRSVRLPPYLLQNNGVRIQVPERDVLELRPGTASGPVAREISRVEKYFRDSAKGLPASVGEFKVYFDPAIMGITQTDGLFSANPTLGRGMQLGGKALLGNQNLIVELLRHELRHTKAYFDLISGRPTLNRGSLIDETQGRLLENTAGRPKAFASGYGEKFSLEEIDAFMANVKANQTRLRGQLRTGAAVTSSANTKVTALRRVQNVKRFIDATRDNLGKVREALKMAKNPDDWSAITSLAAYDNYPGFKELTVNFAADPKNPLRSAERKFVLFIPNAVAEKGTQAQVAEVRQYIEDMTLKMFDVEKELAVREQQINSYNIP